MKFIDRFFLGIYTLCIAVISLVLIVIPFNAFTYNWAIYFFEKYQMNLENSIIPMIFFIMSIRFLLSGTKNSKSEIKSIIRHSNYGEIQISIEAIQNMAEKASKCIHGLKDLKATAKYKDDHLFIEIKAFALSDTNIPETSISIQQKVKEHIEATTGIKVTDVKIMIHDIALQSKKRVE
ncbi:alkaline shock response membrane anchor protein AmaP [Inediibacterium massiliense]|uniref:alkaline shock response membrane anchor protein AmaP n=1 Tax=Inediibacterium massiliense TaxID=1658111 RepID=UPI0006B69C44|nr:alkaline shock response membrane anchor protein AmaP [Inediibacterium massiliense]